MFKKIIPLAIITAVFLSGCAFKGNSKISSMISNNKAEITVYIPKGTHLDPKYNKDKDVAINYLPNRKDGYTKKDVENIVNNIDKHVKVLIITSEKPGLEPVFKMVKSKLPGVVTVAGDMQEMRDDDLYKISKDQNINVSLKIDRELNGVVSLKMAKMMKAKKFIYLYLPNNPNYNVDLEKTKLYSKKLGLQFIPVKLNPNDITQDIVDNAILKKIDGDFSTTAVYPSSDKLSPLVLNLCKDKKFIIPNLNSDNDGKLMAKTFGLEKEYLDDSRSVFDKKLDKKLKEYGLDNKIAGISEGKMSIPAEISIETSKYMYEKNYMLEECYEDGSLIERGNRRLDLLIHPEDIFQSNSYSRNLILYPRIY